MKHTMKGVWFALSIATAGTPALAQPMQSTRLQGPTNTMPSSVGLAQRMPDSNGDPRQPAGMPAESMSDTDFVQAAARSGLTEVETSRVAATRTGTPAVRKFAKMMVADHTKANHELERLAADKGLQMPGQAAVDPDVTQLKTLSGHDFDMAYLRVAGPAAHRKAVALFQQESHAGRDPQLRQFAAKTLPTLQHHLTAANELQARLEKGGR